MTRDLNPGTKVQRGDTRAVSEEARRLGYEPKDAPARGVAWGVAKLELGHEEIEVERQA